MSDIVKRLRYIQEQGQCDCTICETAGDAATEIETLRSQVGYLLGQMQLVAKEVQQLNAVIGTAHIAVKQGLLFTAIEILKGNDDYYDD